MNEFVHKMPPFASALVCWALAVFLPNELQSGLVSPLP